MFSSQVVQETLNSITDLVKFEEELRTTRQRGYAIDHEEHLLRTFCVGFPIFDSKGDVIAAISVSGRDLDLIIENLEHIRYMVELILHLL